VEKLRAEERGHAYDEKRSGPAAPDSGAIRPLFGPDSGPVPPAKNAGSSSERAPEKRVEDKNTRSRNDATDAAA